MELNKECIICLESLESQKIVSLPCKCSNSVYHVACISKLLLSGENKNFCPHCRQKYEVALTPAVQPLPLQSVLPLPLQAVLPLPQPDADMESRKFTYIYVVHILTNSFMNVVNIGMSNDYENAETDIISKILLISYFCKIIINVCIIVHTKSDLEKIKKNLIMSYTIQTFMFILLICLLATTEKITATDWLLFGNNVLFCSLDIAVRIRILHLCTFHNL